MICCCNARLRRICEQNEVIISSYYLAGQIGIISSTLEEMSVIRVKNKEATTSHTYKAKPLCFSTSPSVLKSFKLTKSWMNCYHGSILLSPHVVQWPKNHDSAMFFFLLLIDPTVWARLFWVFEMWLSWLNAFILFSNCHQSGSSLMWREFLVRDCWYICGSVIILWFEFGLNVF